MPTLGASVGQELYDKYKILATDTGQTMSSVVKQALENTGIVDLKKMKSLELERLAKLSWIASNTLQIARYCETKKLIDALVLTSLLEIENACKNI